MTSVISPAEKAASSSLIGRRLAVFESHPVVRLAIQEAFQKAGANVVSIYDERLDGAVLSIGLNYESTTVVLAQDLCRRYIPFLFYTGQGEVDIDPVRRRWPRCKFVTKPHSAAEIARAIVWLFELSGSGEVYGRMPSSTPASGNSGPELQGDRSRLRASQ